jgi:ubiquinone/menaquinone biosynthesis C-methylase UbiE
MMTERTLTSETTGQTLPQKSATDPPRFDWLNAELPDTWPDRFNFFTLHHWWQAIGRLVRSPRRVELPPDLPGREFLPKYLTLEFHGLPNGNFSKRMTRGYITAFDRVMLGTLKSARRSAANELKECEAVLDIGCGGGPMCTELIQVGVRDVWGVDSSPYLLQHAARACPEGKFVHALAERLNFRDARFDAVTVCFLLHEMPPRMVRQALDEIRRVLKPGGTLWLCEPSAEQMRNSFWKMFRKHGWRGIYFKLLAHRVYEPFVAAWHRLDIAALLAEAGFELVADQAAMPLRIVNARVRLASITS